MPGLGSSPRERFIWGVLIAGLLAVALVTVVTRFQSPRRGLERFGPVPSFTLTDQDSASLSDTQLAGRVWLADFMFTRCGSLCPMLTRRMQETVSALAGREGWTMVSFSVDPEYDTPTVLAAYARDHGVDTSRWSFLTGPKETVRDLSVRGFHLAVDDAPTGGGDPILHSQSIVLVDAEGEIRGYYDALDADEMARLPRDTIRLLKEAR